MSAPKLAVIAAELYRELQEIGFGPCPDCGEENESCETCGGTHTDREVNGGDLVELMGRYFDRLDEACSRAVGRPARQEALLLD